MLGYKTSLGKFKKTEIISSIFSNHNTVRLEINYKEKNCKKIHKYVGLKQHATEQPIGQRRNQKNISRQMKMEIKYTVINAYIKKRKRSQINYLTLHLKKLEKEQMKPKISRRKEITKIRAEINEIKMRKSTENINKTQSWFFEKIKLTNL